MVAILQKYQRQIKVFITANIFAFLCYGIYLFPHYSQDVYSKYYDEGVRGTTLQWALNSGRYIFAFLNYLYVHLTKSYGMNSLFSNGGSIIFIALIISISYFIISKKEDTKKRELFLEITYFLCSALLLLNPFFCDWFQFPECLPFYILGILAAICSAEILFNNKLKFLFRFLLSVILFLIAIGLYQPVVIYFVFFSLIKIWKIILDEQNSKFKVLIKNGFIAISVYLLGAFVQIGVMSFAEQTTRVNKNILENLNTILRLQKELWLLETSGSSSIIYLVIFFIFVLCFMFFNISLTKNKMDKWKYCFIVGILFIGFYLAIFATHLVAEPWLSQRTTTAFLSTVSFLGIITALFIEKNDFKNISINIYKKISIILLLFLQIVFFYRSNKLAIDLIVTNVQDAQIVNNINEIMNSYEQEAGIEINKIAVVPDMYITYGYPNVFVKFDLNVRAWCSKWTIPGLINFYTDRNLELVDMPEEIYEKNFKDKDWTTYSEEQIIIEEDTIYIAIY